VAPKRHGLVISTVAQQPVPMDGRCGWPESLDGISGALGNRFCRPDPVARKGRGISRGQSPGRHRGSTWWTAAA